MKFTGRFSKEELDEYATGRGYVDWNEFRNYALDEEVKAALQQIEIDR